MVLRFGMFYGPQDAMTMQKVDGIRRGMFPLFGRPDAHCSWVAHEDAASAVVAALRVPAGETLARSLRISNRRLKGASGWAPRYLTALDGFRTILGSSVGTRGA